MIPILSGNVASAIGGGYEVANSCRFEEGRTTSLSRTLGTPTTANVWTFSCWVKKSKLGDYQVLLAADVSGSGHRDCIRFQSDGKLTVFFNEVADGEVKTNRVFRDPSAWYHIVVAVDTTQATDTNRVKIYVNGTQETSLATSSYPAEDYTCGMNTNDVHRIGRDFLYSEYFDGYMAEVCFIDGQQLTPTSFGEFDEDSPTIWKPKDVSGLTFGDNGAYLDFEDSDNLGDDESGNANDWAENNIAATDQATDTPTNNFCTLNPLDHNNVTFSEGNLKGSCGSSGTCRSTMAVNKGKWYWEFKYIDEEGFHGIRATHLGVTDNTFSVKIFGKNDPIEAHINGSQNDLTGRDNMSANDILNFALDMDNNRFAIGQNGAWDNGSAFSGTTLNYHSITGGHYYSPQIATGSGTGRVCEVNFGSPSFSISSGNADANGYGNFEYAPPSGYLALCTKNLAEEG